jgi:hypothetical protein
VETTEEKLFLRLHLLENGLKVFHPFSFSAPRQPLPFLLSLIYIYAHTIMKNARKVFPSYFRLK